MVVVNLTTLKEVAKPNLFYGNLEIVGERDDLENFVCKTGISLISNTGVKVVDFDTENGLETVKENLENVLNVGLGNG